MRGQSAFWGTATILAFSISSIGCDAGFKSLSMSSSQNDLSVMEKRRSSQQRITLETPTLINNGNAYSVTGSAPAGLALQIFVDGQLWRADFAADASGRYSSFVTFNDPAANYRMSDGDHSVQVIGQLSNGATILSPTLTFNVSSSVVVMPAPSPSPSPSPTSTVGLISNYNPTPDASFLIDGLSYEVNTPGKSWSMNKLDSTSLRFELRSGDRYCTKNYCDPTDAERTEVSDYKDIYYNGTPIYISYGFSVEAGAPITSDWFLLGQMHDVEVGDSPPFSIQVLNDRLAVSIAWLRGISNGVTSVWDTTVNGQKVSYGFVYIDSKPIVRDHLYNMKMTVRFDNTNGMLLITQDGQTIVNYKGPLGFGYDNKWEYGIYRSSSSFTTAVTYRNMHVGTSP